MEPTGLSHFCQWHETGDHSNPVKITKQRADGTPAWVTESILKIEKKKYEVLLSKWCQKQEQIQPS